MLDFRPDLDPRTPGVLTGVSEMVPTAKGYVSMVAEVAHSAHTYTLAANEVWPNAVFASRWQSAAGGIVIVGTNKKLNVYDLVNGFIDVSKGGGYSLGTLPYQYGEDALGAFDLCSFGDVIIACNRSVTAQKRSALDLTVGTLFSDLGGATAAPTANTCCVASNFVFLGDVGNWSTVTGSPDILAWSAIGDHTDWRVNPQVTQCSYAQFVDTPGAITAVRQFQDSILVFKANSMYRGRYVGAGPNSPIWDFERLNDRIGCIGHRSIINIDHGIVFVGEADIYIYDGTRIQAITRGIWEYLRKNGLFYGGGLTPLLLGHHKSDQSVWFCTLTATFTWNYFLDKWGMLSTTQTVQAVPCQTNFANFPSITVTSVSGGVPTVSISTNHDSLYSLYFVQGSPKNRNRNNVFPDHYLTTGWFGQPDKLMTLQRVNPIFSLRPTPVNAALTVYPSLTPGDSTTSGGATMNASYRIDTLGPTNAGATSNYFSFKLAFTGSGPPGGIASEVVDVVPKFVPAGER
jgi:hypothetical protein